jgi:hypothetical protein
MLKFTGKAFMLKFIVAGTGRSGTVYAARVLTDLGIPCGHESIFNYEDEEIVIKRFLGLLPPTISECSANYGWVRLDSIVADSSYMVVPYLNRQGVKEVPIIHIVRNPLQVVSSFVKDLEYFCDKINNTYNINGWEQWIYKHNPEISVTTNSLERACCHWTSWNQKIEQMSQNRKYYFHRVEDDFKDDFFDFIGIKKREIGFKNKRINTMKKRMDNFKIEDIPEGVIKQNFLTLMAKYGY